MHASENPHGLRSGFLDAIDPGRHFYRLFDHLSAILFFAKDREGRLMAANRALLHRYGLTQEANIVGKTDFDFLPRSLAEKFRADDQTIMESGQPMLEIVELYPNRQGVPDWYLTNKRPIWDRRGNIIGVMGTIEPYESFRETYPPEWDITPALHHIRSHFHQDLSIPGLAGRCGMSVRQFERKFKTHLHTSPQQFIIKTRIHAACDLLRKSTRPIAEIARHLGFYDQSSFTRHFRKHMGITPLQYRREYHLEPA